MSDEITGITIDAARYAVVFAADVEPDKYTSVMNTCDFEELAMRLGIEADRLRLEAKEADQDFWPVPWVEAAAQCFNAMDDLSRDAVGEGNAFAVEMLINAGNAEIEAMRG